MLSEVGALAFGAVLGWAGAGFTTAGWRLLGSGLAVAVAALEVQVVGGASAALAAVGAVAGALGRVGVDAAIAFRAGRSAG